MTEASDRTGAGGGFDLGDGLTMAAIFAIALGLRLTYLEQAGALPFFEQPIVDAKSYDDWGQAIAAGDWIGSQTFYQAPAYPYFLGLVYTLFGHDLWVLRVVQMVLGASACALLYATTQILFGRGAAWAAGLLLAGYAPAIFFDGLIQKTNLGLFLTSGLLLLLTAFVRTPRTGVAVAAGLLLGLLALTRENALAFAAVIPVGLGWLMRNRTGTRPLVWTCAFALGVALVLVPVGVRNAAVGGTFAITTSQMGPNFYIGNSAKATGFYQPLVVGRHTPVEERPDATRLAERELGRTLTAGEVSRFYMSESFRWIVNNPEAWLRLTMKKVLLTVNDYEIPDTEDLYVNAEFSPLLAALTPIGRFGVLLPLALAGAVFAWRERGRETNAAMLIALMAIAFTVAVAAFYVWARYRFPLVPLLIPFAGLGIVRVSSALRRTAWRSLLAPAAVAALAALVANQTLLDRNLSLGTAWTNLGIMMLDTHRLPEAEAYLTRSAALNAEGPDIQFQLGLLRFRQKRYRLAEQHLRRADAADARAHRLLAQILARQGRAADARSHRIRAAELSPERR